MGGVVAILAQMQPPNLSPLLTSHVVPQIPLQPLINSLCLAICLGVVARARSELGTDQPKKLLLESSHEIAIPVTHNVLRKLV